MSHTDWKSFIQTVNEHAITEASVGVSPQLSAAVSKWRGHWNLRPEQVNPQNLLSMFNDGAFGTELKRYVKPSASHGEVGFSCPLNVFTRLTGLQTRDIEAIDNRADDYDASIYVKNNTVIITTEDA